MTKTPASLTALACLCLTSQATLAVPVYSLQTLGFYDAENTRYDGYQESRLFQTNTNGYATGMSRRYGSRNVGNIGRASWIYNGTDTIRTGLTGSGFTGADNRQYSDTYKLNNAGMAAGISFMYASTGTSSYGSAAWLFDGSSTIRVGLVDLEHQASGGQNTRVADLNGAGFVVGTSIRRPGSRFAPKSGQSAWLYDGNSTLKIGLIDVEHTGITSPNSSRDYKFSEVAKLNNAGQAIGRSMRLNGSIPGDATGYSAWLYSGGTTTKTGFTGVQYTRDDDYKNSQALFLNDAGQVVGYSDRFTGSNSIGRNAWSYKNGTTSTIGLTGATYTRDDGYQYSLISRLNQKGTAVGSSWRYSGSNSLGYSAWYYNGSSTTEIGLTGAPYTNTAGGKNNSVNLLNEVGQAAGMSNRFDGTLVGQSAWYFGGKGGAIEIGLYNPEHTSQEGKKWNVPYKINETGQVLGYANRYYGTSGSADQTLGRSVWLYGANTTTKIGLTGATYTRNDGYTYNFSDTLNDAGQVAGYAERYAGANSNLGQTVWFYDAATGMTYFNDFSARSSDGYAFSTAEYLGEDGLMLGYYELFDSGSSLLGNRAFAFTIEDGFFDLGQQVTGDLTSFNWESLAQTFSADLSGNIFGTGKLVGMNGQAVYLASPTSAVPVPAAVWLFGSGLLGLLGFAKRKGGRHYDA